MVLAGDRSQLGAIAKTLRDQKRRKLKETKPMSESQRLWLREKLAELTLNKLKKKIAKRKIEEIENYSAMDFDISNVPFGYENE